MSLDTYRVTCAHGHDAVLMEGAEALAHVRACYGRKALPDTRGAIAGKGWDATGKGKPWPWRAPGPDREGLAGLMRRIDAGEYDGQLGVDKNGCVIEDWQPRREGLWRYDRSSDDPVPLHLLPTAIREILEVVMGDDTGRWALKVEADKISVTVARTPDDETRIRLRGKSVTVTVGSYRKPSTVSVARRSWIGRTA